MARIKWVFAVFLCVCVLPVTTLARQSNPEKKLYAFVNVNVIPMDREQVLENQVVLVKNGKISQIGPANHVKIPKKAERIEAGGKFLLPGLIDAHAHLASDTNLPNDLARQWLKLNLANGITTIRNMVGNPSHLVLRDRIARGEALGPTLITSGPPILGFMAPNPAEGEQLVTEYKNAGFDLIKVHENLSPQTYDAIVA
ncbi:MAG TPA: amidohydrolase family protein, partial [Acidobacteriota bacterium]|nr:amidohydrolase family protein [Acidobacteriota bacterium]